MIARSSRPVNADAQDVLFYLYAGDLPGLRQTLIEQGLSVGDIGYPDYLPKGEFQMHDPDGYTLMIAQSAPDTP